MLGFFDNEKIESDESHVRNLILMAKADNSIDKSELEVIFTVGKQRGFSKEEVIELDQILKNQKVELKNLDKEISGFNIGVNIGKDAGQSIMHCHLHLIPRRKGDVEDPRGGVRGVIPEKQKYKRE